MEVLRMCAEMKSDSNLNITQMTPVLDKVLFPY